MPKIQKPHRPALIDREHFRLLSAKEHDPEDPYYYRFDPEYNFGKTTTGFQLPRQTPETTCDTEALAYVIEHLPEGHAVFRLGWWISWSHCAARISCAQPHDKLIISRIRKVDLESMPGVEICEDPLLPNRAVLSYTVEPLSDSNEKFSNLILPFERMEYLYTEFEWSPATPLESEETVAAPSEPQPEPIRQADIPWALTLQSMANGALNLYGLIDRSSRPAYEFGDAARSALKACGVRCGSTDRLQMLKILAWVAGSWYYKPDPEQISSDLLVIVCRECERMGRPWIEGRRELERRAELKGIHRLVWNLRDSGLISMNSRRRVGDPEPMFP